MKTFSRLFLLLTAILVTCSMANAQSSGFRVVSDHPDFKVKVTRCEASARTVVVDMLLENISSQDIMMRFSPAYMIKVYDDEGNTYGDGDSKIHVFIGGQNKDYSLLPPEIPVKFRIQIDGVPESVGVLKRIDVSWASDQWTQGLFNKVLKLVNVPVTHEGD